MNKVLVASILVLVAASAFAAATFPGRYTETHAIQEEVNCSVCHERPYSVGNTSADPHYPGAKPTRNGSVSLGETHDIGERVTCLTCHRDVADAVVNGSHITLQRVSNSHPNVSREMVAETHYRFDGERTDTELVDDACLSCHSTHRQFQKFAVADPYLYKQQPDTPARGQPDERKRVGSFVELGVREWPVSQSTRVLGESNPIGVTATNVDTVPVTVNVTVLLADYADHQTQSTYAYQWVLAPGDAESIETPPVLGDYFEVELESNRSVDLRVEVNGTYNDVPTETVQPPAELPRNSSYEPRLYHTAAIYRQQQLDDTLRGWGDMLRSPHAIAHLTVYDRATLVRNRSGHQFDAPTMLYYIRRNTTQMGQYRMLGDSTPVYTHETGRVTTLVCASCHLHAIGDEDITEDTCGDSCHPHEWGAG